MISIISFADLLTITPPKLHSSRISRTREDLFSCGHHICLWGWAGRQGGDSEDKGEATSHISMRTVPSLPVESAATNKAVLLVLGRSVVLGVQIPSAQVFCLLDSDPDCRCYAQACWLITHLHLIIPRFCQSLVKGLLDKLPINADAKALLSRMLYL